MTSTYLSVIYELPISYLLICYLVTILRRLFVIHFYSHTYQQQSNLLLLNFHNMPTYFHRLPVVCCLKFLHILVCSHVIVKQENSVHRNLRMNFQRPPLNYILANSNSHTQRDIQKDNCSFHISIHFCNQNLNHNLHDRYRNQCSNFHRCPKQGKKIRNLKWV